MLSPKNYIAANFDSDTASDDDIRNTLPAELAEEVIKAKHGTRIPVAISFGDTERPNWGYLGLADSYARKRTSKHMQAREEARREAVREYWANVRRNRYV